MHKTQDDDYEMLRSPEKTKPVDPEQFRFAMQLASAASSYRMPMDSPAKQRIMIEMPDGNVQQFSFTDIPMNRAAIAIRDHFAPDIETAMCALMRWRALARVISSPSMRKWERHSEEDPEGIEIHGAVIHAAAVMPLTKNGHFDKRKFFKTVEEIASSEEYAEKSE
jgi:hypothetical protein